MRPRSPISALPGERLPGIGHNHGPPLDAGHGFRRFAWKKARAELMPRLPIEVLKRRVARARQLGLAYPQYASILLGTGRDIVGFLFTCDALGLRLEKSVALPEPVRAKLAGLENCERMLLGPAHTNAVQSGAMQSEAVQSGAAQSDSARSESAQSDFRQQDLGALTRALEHATRITFAGTAAAPAAAASWQDCRSAIRSALDPLKLPSDAVVMIGARAEERAWADAAKLARFLPRDAYFSG